jgi:hypothetical protein
MSWWDKVVAGFRGRASDPDSLLYNPVSAAKAAAEDGGENKWNIRTPFKQAGRVFNWLMNIDVAPIKTALGLYNYMNPQGISGSEKYSDPEIKKLYYSTDPADTERMFELYAAKGIELSERQKQSHREMGAQLRSEQNTYFQAYRRYRNMGVGDLTARKYALNREVVASAKWHWQRMWGGASLDHLLNNWAEGNDSLGLNEQMDAAWDDAVNFTWTFAFEPQAQAEYDRLREAGTPAREAAQMTQDPTLELAGDVYVGLGVSGMIPAVDAAQALPFKAVLGAGKKVLGKSARFITEKVPGLNELMTGMSVRTQGTVARMATEETVEWMAGHGYEHATPEQMVRLLGGKLDDLPASVVEEMPSRIRNNWGYVRSNTGALSAAAQAVPQAVVGRPALTQFAELAGHAVSSAVQDKALASMPSGFLKSYYALSEKRLARSVMTVQGAVLRLWLARGPAGREQHPGQHPAPDGAWHQPECVPARLAESVHGLRGQPRRCC